MLVIRARNVNDAYTQGLHFLHSYGQMEETRGGKCLVMPFPVTTMYTRPMQRVLWDPQRNANPFFHLAEALWMLRGQRDARWLDKFVSDFSSRFAEADGMQHGAYGYRWRNHFDLDGGGAGGPIDQLDLIVRILQENPSDRRAVLSMWDPMADLGITTKKDIPCNTQAYFRIHRDPESTGGDAPMVLDMMVTCRSNDLVWGAYGANAVHFSVLQEYMARRIGVQIGNYYQVSFNYHAYQATLPTEWGKDEDLYKMGVGPSPIVTDPENIDADLEMFFKTYEDEGFGPDFHNPFLGAIARPMFKLYERRRELTQADLAEWGNRRSNSDWGIIAVQWLDRWLSKRSKG
jgi:hypothetical protein